MTDLELTCSAATLSGRASLAAVLTTIRAYSTLLKPKITILLTAYGVFAALLAAGGTVSFARLGLFALLGFMASGGAATLNHLFERDIDARMARTRQRPLPSGRVTPRAAAILATALLGISIPAAWLLLGPPVAAWFALGALVYGGLYTRYLKPRTPMNIVIGGLAGSCGALAGWSLADPGLALGGWLLALIVFLWTPSHFWGLAIARDADYRAVGLPMLPQVRGITRTATAMLGYTVATWIASLMLVPATDLGLVYGAGATLLGVVFTGLCVAFRLRPTAARGQQVFKFSGLYLLLLLLFMGIDTVI